VTDPLEAARAALRQRQGPGARHDAAVAPARELDWARRGTAYFARLLTALPDDRFDAPSAVEGLSRRDVVAQVGYHARALSDLVSWARQGRLDAWPGSGVVERAAVRRWASQPVRALRTLFAHTAIHLDVEWRDLDEAQWGVTVRDSAGHVLAIRDTPLVRARMVWRCAVDLRTGGRLADLPPDLVAGSAHGLSERQDAPTA